MIRSGQDGAHRRNSRARVRMKTTSRPVAAKGAVQDQVTPVDRPQNAPQQRCQTDCQNPPGPHHQKGKCSDLKYPQHKPNPRDGLSGDGGDRSAPGIGERKMMRENITVQYIAMTHHASGHKVVGFVNKTTGVEIQRAQDCSDTQQHPAGQGAPPAAFNFIWHHQRSVYYGLCCLNSIFHTPMNP